MRTNLHSKTVARVVSDIKKDYGCYDCGYNEHVEALDFDHIKPVLYGKVSNLVTRRYSLKKIMEEIKQCQVVCANCHRVRTAERRERVEL